MQTQQGQNSGRGNPQNENIQIASYLKGADFPASKEDLVECAQQNDADDEIVETLRALPQDSFENITDVTKAWSQSARNSDSEEDTEDEQ